MRVARKEHCQWNTVLEIIKTFFGLLRQEKHGKTFDMRFMHILYDNPDLSLEVIYMLDKVQKEQGKELSNNERKNLRASSVRIRSREV